MVDSVVTRHHRTGPSAPRSRTVGSPLGCRSGDHLCWAFDDVKSWRVAAGRFLAEGIALGERVLYACGSVADVDLTDLELANGGLTDVAPGPAGSSGVEIIRVTALAPLRNAGQIGSWLANAVDAAMLDGYTGLRVAMDASDLATSQGALERQIAREVFLDRAVATRPVALLCGYDRGRVPRLDALARVHPATNATGTAASVGLVFADHGWALTGEIDLAVVDDVKIALLAGAALSDDDLQVDCSGVTFLSVSGVEMFVAVAQAMGCERRLVVRNPPAIFRRVVSIGWPEGIPRLAVG